MKKNLKLPTIIGVLLLVAGLVAGIFLINSRQVFKLGAQGETAPRNVRISNISDTSFTVTWTTDLKTTGFIKSGQSENSLGKVSLEEGSEKSYVHLVNVLGLTHGANQYFIINSDGTDHDNDGIVWQTKTLAQKTPDSATALASGTVLGVDGATPTPSLVHLTVNGTVLSNLTSSEGTWIIPLSNYLAPIPETTAIEISVNAGQDGTAQAIIYPKAIKATPVIVLGKTYDFRTLNPGDSTNLPESNITAPEALELSSRFEITKDETGIQVTTVTLESIDEGEIITTTNPEFFGTAPKDTSIEISVQSELQTETVTTPSSGIWNWSPPANLEPGEHTITLKWKDASGIARTITRKFVVQASEGPAFESTPSATPIQTQTPSSSPISTPSTLPVVTTTPTGTMQPTPETGNLTPTIGLFIMGIGIFLSSVLVWKKANV